MGMLCGRFGERGVCFQAHREIMINSVSDSRMLGAR